MVEGHGRRGRGHPEEMPLEELEQTRQVQTLATVLSHEHLPCVSALGMKCCLSSKGLRHLTPSRKAITTITTIFPTHKQSQKQLQS